MDAEEKFVVNAEYFRIDIILTDDLGFKNSFYLTMIIEPVAVVTVIEEEEEVVVEEEVPECDCTSTDDACSEFL